MNKENWEKRFDELIKGTEQNDHEDRLRFCSCMEGDLDDVFPKDIAVIKSFISTERARVRSEAVELIERFSSRDDEAIMTDIGESARYQAPCARKTCNLLVDTIKSRTPSEEGDLSTK